MTTLISAGAGLLTLFISIFLPYKLNKMSKRTEAHETLRRTESVLIMKNIDAIGTLAEKTAVCVKNQRVNGDLDAAIAYRAKQKHEMEEYLYDVNATQAR